MSEEDGCVWYFAYASFMNAEVFSQVIGELSAPLERQSAYAEGAWLAFDYCGIPYVEPAYASLIISGYNDGLFKHQGREKSNTAEYMHYIHDRCYPGIPYDQHDGRLPPFVEGILYKLTHEQFACVTAPTGFDIAPIRCCRFSSGDKSKRLGDFVAAYTLVAKNSYRSSHLMPSVRTFFPIYRGALTIPLSVDYCRYLVHLRPYNPAHGSKSAQWGQRIFIATVLVPQFLALYLPIALLQSAMLGNFAHSRIERWKLNVVDFIRWSASSIEKSLFRPIFGNNAYGIDES